MPSIEKLLILREKYLELLQLEVGELRVKPTEVRHLIGRLGEIHCALTVGGTLAHQVNQHGFDVTSPEGHLISVKTTAQTSGFVIIGSQNSIGKAHELMIIQYKEGELSVLYHGPIALAKQAARPYARHYELELTKARELMERITSAQAAGIVTPTQTHPHPGMPGSAHDAHAAPAPTA